MKEGMLKYVAKPSHLLCLVWLLLFIFFYIQPIVYDQYVGFDVWAYIFSAIALFKIGEQYGFYCASDLTTQKEVASVYLTTRYQKVFNRVVTLSSILGLVGIFLLAYDKIFLSGLDYSKGLAYLRMKGEQSVQNPDIHRSIWLYIGYPLLSFSYPAIMLLVLKPHLIRSSVAYLAQLSILSPIGYAVLYGGGRMSILILLLLLLSCCLIRSLQGEKIIPREHGLLLKIIILGCSLAIYSNYVLLARRDVSHQTYYSNFLANASNSWGVEPKTWLNRLVENESISENTAMNLITNAMYITNGIVSLSKIIDMEEIFKPYWGTYQIGILSPLLRIFYKNNTILSSMENGLRFSLLYGFYITGWGAIYLDFGFLGAVIFILSFGFLSGYMTVRATDPNAVDAQLLSAFCYTSIIMSIFNGPFGMANSFLIFMSLLAVSAFLKIENRRAVSFNNQWVLP